MLKENYAQNSEYLDVKSVVIDAFENARFLCERYYLASPSLQLECFNTVKKDAQISIVTVPSHLYHIMFELIKVRVFSVEYSFSFLRCL